ncbi:MAG: hypothetical protein WC819_04065 [Parcubacteria group bacterium]|jgi:hypothetical protein
MEFSERIQNPTAQEDRQARQLHDWVGRENTAVQNELGRYGINGLATIFTFDTQPTAHAEAVKNIDVVQEMLVSKNDSDNEHNEHDDLEKEKPDTETFVVTSQQQLYEMLYQHYAKNEEIAQKILKQKNVPTEKHVTVVKEVFSNMAQKTIAIFKEEQIRQLMTQGLNKNDAEKYYAWRLDEYTADNSLSLEGDKKQEMIHADHFFDHDLLRLFQEKNSAELTAVTQESTPRSFDLSNSSNILTSKEIEAEQEKLGNI